MEYLIKFPVTNALKWYPRLVEIVITELQRNMLAVFMGKNSAYLARNVLRLSRYTKAAPMERAKVMPEDSAELRAAKYLILATERMNAIERANAVADSWEEIASIGEINSTKVLIRKMVRELRMALMAQ